jgi:WS/DGAT/MGAT family acyltransferase
MNRTEPLSSADTAWLRMDQPTNLMLVCGVMILDRPLAAEDLKSLIRSRLLSFDRFRQRIDERRGSFVWEEDPLFDLDSHVHRIGLPAPAQQHELETVVADLMAMPLDLSKPPWQVHLVDRYGKGSALIVRLHHCIADGIALVRLLLSLTDAAPRPHRRESTDESDNPLWALFRPAASLASMATAGAQALLHEGVEIVRHPAHALELARDSVDIAQTIGRLTLLPADSDTMFRGPLGIKKSVGWTGGIPLADVKQIGHALEATVNDVLISAVAGSLRRYLRAHRRPVTGVEIRIVVPVDLRRIEDVPKLGNRFGLVFVELPIGIGDAAERLREIVRRTQAIKHSLDAPVAFGLLQAIGMASASAERQLIDLFSRKATAVVTNVPGPRQKLHLAGAQLTQMMFWVPQSGRIGLGFSILSYDHEVCIGITADAGLVPDPQRLLDAVRDELAQLAAAAGAAGAPRSARAK